MPNDSNYFEEAYRLCADQDPVVSGVAKALYENMRASHNQHGLSPQEGFNILYFFQSAIRLVLECRPDIAVGATQYPYPCDPIHAVNCPDEPGPTDQNRELRTRYVELVKSDSIPNGSDFDVSYAVAILSRAVGSSAQFEHRGTKVETDEPNFDEWLAGFNRE